MTNRKRTTRNTPADDYLARKFDQGDLVWVNDILVPVSALKDSK